VLPVIIFVAVALPLLVIAFIAASRRRTEGEHPAGETDADRAEVEAEFAEAERYQAEWREGQHRGPEANG
jgi:hypothetical protein